MSLLLRLVLRLRHWFRHWFHHWFHRRLLCVLLRWLSTLHLTQQRPVLPVFSIILKQRLLLDAPLRVELIPVRVACRRIGLRLREVFLVIVRDLDQRVLLGEDGRPHLTRYPDHLFVGGQLHVVGVVVAAALPPVVRGGRGAAGLPAGPS